LAEHGTATIWEESSSQQSITPQMVRKFARTARSRMRIDGGGYRRDHLRALAQRVEVADKEVRITGSKSDLLRTLAAGPGRGPVTPGVRSSVLKWRTGRDSNPRWLLHHARFPSVCLKPLGHLSWERPPTPRLRRVDRRRYSVADGQGNGLPPEGWLL
jgi:site-specific DNA recombinase